jgi:hypothetical protein
VTARSTPDRRGRWVGRERVFLGIGGGIMASHLPGFAETPAVAVLVGAACVSVLRLPLSSVVIA